MSHVIFSRLYVQNEILEDTANNITSSVLAVDTFRNEVGVFLNITMSFGGFVKVASE